MLAQSENNPVGFARAGSCRVWLWAMKKAGHDGNSKSQAVFSALQPFPLAGTGEMGLNKSSVQSAEG